MSRVSPSSGYTDNGVSAALESMRRNALDYSRADVRTLNKSSKRYLLRVLADAATNLKDVESRLDAFGDAGGAAGSPPSAYVIILRRRLQEVGNIVVDAECGLSKLDPCVSSQKWLHQVLSPLLRSSVSKMSEMLMALWHTEAYSLFSPSGISVSLESTILSLSHLASAVDRLGNDPVDTSRRHVCFINTATRASAVIAEAMHEIAAVVTPEYADRVHRGIMMITEVSRLVSPYTHADSVVDFCHYSSFIVRSAGGLMQEIHDANVREKTLIPVVKGLRSIIASAVYVYWSTLEQMLLEKEGLISKLKVVFREDVKKTAKGLLSHSKEPYKNVSLDCKAFLRMGLIECMLYTSMFERKYLKLCAKSGALISNMESDAVKGHIKDMKLGIRHALVGSCEYTGEIGNGVTEDPFLHSVHMFALHSLQKLECILQCLDSQTIERGQYEALLHSLESVAVLLNRALDRLDNGRELYNHHWDPEVSGVVLLPGELPRHRKLFKTTAKSPIGAMMMRYRVKRGLLGVLEQVIAFVIEYVVRLCAGICELIKKLVYNFACLITTNSSRNAMHLQSMAAPEESVSLSPMCDKTETTREICDLGAEGEMSVTTETTAAEHIQQETFSYLHKEFCPLDKKSPRNSSAVNQCTNPPSTLTDASSSESVGCILRK